MSYQIPNWQCVQQAINTGNFYYLPTLNAAQFYSPVDSFGYNYIQQYTVNMERCLDNLYFQKLENQKLRRQLFNLQQHAQKAFEKTNELEEKAKQDSEATNLKRNLFELTSEIEQLKNELKLNFEKDVEMNQLKLQILKLEADLKDRDSKISNLNLHNKMLMDAIEELDESIWQYRKERQENLNSSCNDYSELAHQYPDTVPISDNKSSLFSCKPIIQDNQEPDCSSAYLPCTVTNSFACKECGWISRSDRELDLHMFEKHQIPSLFYVFSKSAFLKNGQQN